MDGTPRLVHWTSVVRVRPRTSRSITDLHYNPPFPRILLHFPSIPPVSPLFSFISLDFTPSPPPFFDLSHFSMGVRGLGYMMG